MVVAILSNKMKLKKKCNLFPKNQFSSCFSEDGIYKDNMGEIDKTRPKNVLEKILPKKL